MITSHPKIWGHDKSKKDSIYLKIFHDMTIHSIEQNNT